MLDGLDWHVEAIPDEADVLMRAHRAFFRGKILQPGVFRLHKDGLSVDWEKYSSPEDTRARGRVPQENAVIRLPVLRIRKISCLDVSHVPEDVNRAHSHLVGLPSGEDLTEARALLLAASKVVLALATVP